MLVTNHFYIKQTKIDTRACDLGMNRTDTCKNLTAHVGRVTADNCLGYLDEKEKLLESMEPELSPQVFHYSAECSFLNVYFFD